jgi:hypothetical protein
MLVLASGACAPDPSRGAATTVRAGDRPAQRGESVLRPATIAHYGDGPALELPAEATAGRPVPITLTTYSGGCSTEERTDVHIDGSRAEIAPLQRVRTPGAYDECTEELDVTRRRLQVVFHRRGPAVVRVTGRVTPGDSVVRVVRMVEIR